MPVLIVMFFSVFVCFLFSILPGASLVIVFPVIVCCVLEFWIRFVEKANLEEVDTMVMYEMC